MTPGLDMKSQQPPPTYFQLLFYEDTIERLPAHQAWTSLLIAITSLLICLAFLYASIRVWRTKCAVAAIPTISEPVPTSSPIEDVIDLYQDAQDEKGRKLSNATSLSSFASTASTARYSPPPRRNSDDIDVCALIALSWAIATIDQVAELVIFISHQTSCPTFVCFDGALTVTSDCPVMYPAFLLGSLTQPIGMCLFALATMIRFVRVYSVLSRARYLALMCGSVLAITATAFRLAMVATHQLMPLWLYQGRLTPVYQPPGPGGNGGDEVQEEPIFVGPQDTLIDIISLATGWSFSVAVCIYTACALMAVGLGMQFVASVRNQVSQALHRPGEAAQVPDAAGRGQRSKTSTTTAGQDAKYVRTTVMLMAAALGCLACFFLAMRADIVNSDQIAVALVNLTFRMIMAMVSLAMVGVNELVVRGNQSDENQV